MPTHHYTFRPSIKVAHKIWIKNKFADEAMVKINLTGLGIGNGLTNPEVQYKYYPEMAVNNSHGYQIVSDGTYTRMKSAVPPCVKLIQECNKGGKINCNSCVIPFAPMKNIIIK